MNKYSKIKYTEPTVEDITRVIDNIRNMNCNITKKNIRTRIKNKLETESIAIWQKMWNEAAVGRWTYSKHQIMERKGD